MIVARAPATRAAARALPVFTARAGRRHGHLVGGVRDAVRSINARHGGGERDPVHPGHPQELAGRPLGSWRSPVATSQPASHPPALSGTLPITGQALRAVT